MDAEQLLSAMTPEVYERLTYAVETGKWPEGTALSKNSATRVCKRLCYINLNITLKLNI